MDDQKPQGPTSGARRLSEPRPNRVGLGDDQVGRTYEAGSSPSQSMAVGHTSVHPQQPGIRRQWAMGWG